MAMAAVAAFQSVALVAALFFLTIFARFLRNFGDSGAAEIRAQ
jgi:hypothetical protein